MPEPHEVSTVADSEMLLRRIPNTPNYVVWDEGTGGERPSSGAFAFDADGVSVYRAGLISVGESPCVTVASLLPDQPARCAELRAAECRAIEMAVEADPTDQAVVGQSHALVQRPHAMGRSKAQRQLAGLSRFCA